MMSEICPYYKTGRICINKDYCCEKEHHTDSENTCMSDTYYAMALVAENKHLNDLLNQALKENEELKKYQYKQEYLQKEIEIRQQKLEKIEEKLRFAAKDYYYGYMQNCYEFIKQALQIIEGEQ